MLNTASNAGTRRGWSFVLVLLLAIAPAAGHGLTLCVCPDGDVSLATECVPQSCCDSDHVGANDSLVAAENDLERTCTELTLVPKSPLLNSSAVPAFSGAGSGPKLAALTPQPASAMPMTDSMALSEALRPPVPEGPRFRSSVLRV